jgi:ATP-dependent DNA helicase RecQ
MKLINTPLEVLKDTYGFDSFRPLQQEVIESLLSQKDTVAIFKTSGGKSLCYQVPAQCVEGTAIVVSPLISLMKDQVDTLNALNIPSAYVNSTHTHEERNGILNRFEKGEYKLFYVSPERLSDIFFSIASNVNISFVAIDEAHCVSMYGRDFRPSYTKIGQFFDLLGEQKDKRIPRIALTATAPVYVREDIMNLLGMKDTVEFLGSFERDNIDFIVRRTEDKTMAIEEVIRQYSADPMIVHCTTVKAVNALYVGLNSDGFEVTRYHGRLSPKEKETNQEAFLDGHINVMIATCAFGMGVDKSDVRTVVHYQLPGNLEGYYQEAGRAGRDGKQSRAILLYSKNDRAIQDFFISSSYPGESEIYEVMNFIYALPSNLMPLDTDMETLSNWCPGQIDSMKMSSVLRILFERGIIDISYNNEDSNTVLIETADHELEAIDFSGISILRRLAMENLAKTVEYATLKSCRTNFVMKHFGQKNKKDCGHCDNCFNKTYFLDKDACVPEEYVFSALTAIASLRGRFSLKVAIQALQGVHNRTTSDQNMSALLGFGALNTWTESGISELINALSRDGMVRYKRKNKPLITSYGEEIIQGIEKPRVKLNLTSSSLVTREMFNTELVTNSNKKTDIEIKMADIDFNFLETLKKGRSYLSKTLHIQPNILINDATLLEICRQRPINAEEFIASGMKSEFAKDFERETLAIFSLCYKKHQEISSDSILVV